MEDEHRSQDGTTNEKSHDNAKKIPFMPILKMEIPYHFGDPESYKRFSLYNLIYSIAGLVLGFTCIIGGIVLFLNGVAGSTSWTAKFLGAESQISDAAPGAILFIVGLFIVFITRFNIKVKK